MIKKTRINEVNSSIKASVNTKIKRRDEVNSSMKALVKKGLRHPNLKAQQGVVKTI